MKWFRMLVMAFVLIALVKLLLSAFVATPTIYSDEYLYAKLARGLAIDSSYTLHGLPQNGYPPLYPLALSLAYVFEDMDVVYFMMKLLNALLSSLIIFPMYFFARRFVPEKESFFLALLVGVLPASFAYTPYLLSENLFFVLFFTTVYFLYVATMDNTFLSFVFAGLFLGLTLLTKTFGVLLLPLFAVIGLYYLFKRSWIHVKNLVVSGVVAGLVYLPWLLYTLSTFGFSFSGVLGRSYSAELTNVISHSIWFVVKNTLIWLALYLGVFALSTGLIFFAGTLLFFRRRSPSSAKQLALFIGILLATVLLFVINHNLHGAIKADTFLDLSGRPLARYTDTLLPLLILVGYLGLRTLKSLTFKHFAPVLLLAFLSFPLLSYPLYPVNNLSLSFLGLLQFVLQFFTSSAILLALAYLVFAFFLSLGAYLLFTSLSKERFLSLAGCFFLLVSFLSLGMTLYHSHVTWYPKEQAQLGLWLEEHIPKDARVVVDSRACTSRSVEDEHSLCSPEGHTTLLGFWVNRNLIIAEHPSSGDYFVSRQHLSYPVFHTTESNIYVYQVD